MSATQGNLAALSRYVFRAPDWPTSLGFALLIAAIAGIGAFESAYVLADAYEGVFFVGIPTVVAAFLTAPLDRRLGGQFTYNRSSLLALACEIVVVVIISVVGLIALVTPLGQTFVLDSLLVALASIFALRLAVVMAVSHRDPLRAAIPASIQTATAAALLFVYSGTLLSLEVGGPLFEAYLEGYLSRAEEAPPELLLVGPSDFLLLAGMCVLYALGVYGFIRVFDRPWRRSLGVSGLDFIQGFIGHIAEGSRELEEFFEEIGEQAIVPVTVLSARRLDGTEKARFVLPMIHPGPMGDIGGGNLPRRVAEDAEGLAFPPHATAGHDFNLVTRSEVERLIDAADRASDRIEYDRTATQSVRSAVGSVSVLGQAFGDGALLVTSFAPTPTDDVEYGVGMSAMAEARASGLESVMLVDAHNCNDGLEGVDLGHVTPGSRRSFDLYDAAAGASERLADLPRHPIEVGTAWEETPWEPRDGIGPLGIRVATLRVGGQETAYVLIDGNNMEPGLRERIVDAVNAVEEIEVMTTDTHVVNTVESVNQVGEAIDSGELIDRITRLIDRARADYEPVAAGMATEHAEVTVFGNDRTETLASHANAAISMGAALAGAVILAVMAVSALIFFLAAS
jgi:putative membrane protein